MKINDDLSLPVPYTLTMKGNGDFVALWKPIEPSNDLPDQVRCTSRSSGIKALERLYDALIEAGVVRL